MSDTFQTRPFLKVRKAYLEVLAAGRRKHVIHGLVDADVTDARRLIRERRASGEDLSFTGFVLHAVAAAVDEDKILHAYRRRSQLVLFDDVDVNLQIEVGLEGQKAVKSLLLRSANRRTVGEISAEIRAGQRPEPAAERRYRGTLAMVSIPGPIRSLLWRFVMGNPRWFKRFGGTVGLSAIGMFGPRGGWGIPIAPPTLMVTVGGIETRPRYVDGVLLPREMLSLTISLDHAVVDGAPAARFARRLTELIETAGSLRGE